MSTENVSFILGAVDNTKSAFGAVRGSLNGLGEQVVSVRGIIGTLTAALGVGAFGAGIKSAAEAADAAAKLGDRFGIATEKMIGLQHAGDLAGLSNEGLTAALRAQAKSLTDAARGSEEAAKAYAQLGIKADEFIKLPMDRQFSIIVDKLGQVENTTLRNAIAQEVLGKSAGEVMGVVAEGSEAFAKAAEDAEAWGLAVSRVDAAKLELANDAITRAQAAAKGLFTTIAIHVAPAVKALADFFADSSAEAGGFKRQAGEAAEVVITGIGYAANVVQGLRFAYTGLKFALAEFLRVAAEGFAWLAEKAETFGSVLRFLPGPLGLAGRMLGAVVASGRKEFELFAESATENSARIKAELDAIALEGLPKDKIIEKVREIRAVMEKEAVEIAKRRQEMMGGAGGEIEKDKATEKKEPKEAWRDKLAQKVEQLREENMVELELLNEKLREKNLLLQDALDSGLITEEVALAQSALIQQKYEQAKTKIIDEETKRRFGISNVYRQLDLQSASGFFGAMSGLMNSQSRTAFQIGKAAAISQTIIDTYRAAQGAFASLAPIPFIGPVLGAAAAAAAIISGMARVQSIKSQQFGGGAVAAPVFSASPTTGIPTEPISPLQSPTDPLRAQAAPQQQDFNVTVLGRSDAKTTYGEVVDDLVPLFEQAVKNGATRMNIQFAN